MSEEMAAKAVPPDYDRDPARFRTARSVLGCYALAPDVHERVARRLVGEGLVPVLDVGCGEGELASHLPDGCWVGVDNSAVMLSQAPEPKCLAEATALPLPDASVSSVALLYVLYHLHDPGRALAEAYRVLRPGGVVVVAAPSRRDSPELSHVLPRTPLTFDAERAPELFDALFTGIEVETWDAPLLELPTAAAVRDYLIGKGADQAAADAEARRVQTPLLVTKRGALVLGRKGSLSSTGPRRPQ